MDGDYIDENTWVSECDRFVAKRVSTRRWIVLERGARWSKSFPDLDTARIAMDGAST